MIDYSKIKIKDLLGFCVHSQSESLDATAYLEDYNIPFDLTDEEQDNGDFVPMMNYCYQLENEFNMPENIKEILGEAGAITLIQKTENDKYYLALSGGGMDLSWEICRAYILLGYLPPAKFCYLPKFAGMDFKKARNKKVIDACVATADFLKTDGENIKEKLLTL